MTLNLKPIIILTEELDFVFDNLNRISFVCASHNEDSILKVMDIMKKENKT